MKQGRDHSSDRGHRERGRHIIPHRNRQFMLEKRGVSFLINFSRNCLEIEK